MITRKPEIDWVSVGDQSARGAVYKYVIELSRFWAHDQPVMVKDFPTDAQSISARWVSAQGDMAYIAVWAAVPGALGPGPSLSRAPRAFYVIGTGRPMPQDVHLRFVSTVFNDEASEVFHVWEVVGEVSY